MTRAAEWLRAKYPAQVATTREPYRLGRVDRATAAYQPAFTSGDSAVQDSQDLMHRRMRDQGRNNSHIHHAIQVYQNLIVGTGMQTLADPFEPWLDMQDLTEEDMDFRLSYALESDELYAEWFNDPQQFDPAGRLDGTSFQAMCISELVTVGMVFLVESIRRVPRGQVGLGYQLIEADQLDRSKNAAGGNGTNRIVDGIELDALGRAVAFWLFVAHPADYFMGVTESKRISADRCQCLFKPSRPSQHLGATWLHANGQTEVDRDKYLTAELQAAAKAAALTLVWKKKNPYSTGGMGLMDGGDESDEHGNRQVRLGSSPLAAVIGQDDDMKIVESNRPNASADKFLKVLDRYSAQGAGISYYSLTGDYESTSFASVRAAKLDEDGQIRPLQQWFATQVALPMRRRFNALAAAQGMFSTIDATEFATNIKRYQRFEGMGPGRELLDPDAETNAAIGRLRSGLSTLKIECAKRGLHWVRVLRQIALENQLTKVLGVVLDFSKGQGGQVTGNTRDAASQGQSTTETAT